MIAMITALPKLVGAFPSKWFVFFFIVVLVGKFSHKFSRIIEVKKIILATVGREGIHLIL